MKKIDIPSWQSDSTPFFTRNKIIVIAITVAIILICSTFVPDDYLIFGRNKQSILILGMGLLIMTFLQPAITLADQISSTYRKVSKIAHPSVTVQKHHDATVLVNFARQHKFATIFLGFADDNVLTQMLALRHESHKCDIYINPDVLPILIKTELPPNSVHVVDCPRESCVVFAYDTEDKMHCLTLRRIQNKQLYWSATIEPDSKFAEYMSSTFLSYYQNGNCVLLQNLSMARCLNKVNIDRRRHDQEIRHGILEFYIREEGYRFFTELVEQAKKSIYAVDFMPPAVWRADRVLREYERAHGKSVSPIKQRIHVFNRDALKSTVTEYKDYVKRQLSFGVKLYFMDEEEVRGPGTSTGWIIIDEEVVFISEGEEALSDWYGRVDFNEVEGYRHKFESLRAQCHTEIKSPEDIDGLLWPVQPGEPSERS